MIWLRLIPTAFAAISGVRGLLAAGALAGVAGSWGGAVTPLVASVANALAAAVQIVCDGVMAILANPKTLAIVAIAVGYGWWEGHGPVLDARAELRRCKVELVSRPKAPAAKPRATPPSPCFFCDWGF